VPPAVERAADIAGLLAIAVCITVVVHRAATAPLPPPPRAATAAERTSFAAEARRREGDWRVKAANDFPADQWSQRDAFHGHEAQFVRDLARGSGVSYEEVLGAIDADIHRNRGSDRNAEVVPCKPRPVFD